jgi:hypothetical protein
MKFFLLVGCLCCLQFASAQHDTTLLRQSIADLNKALVTRNKVVLSQLLHEKVSYGHSNGWVQTKREVMDDFFNGKLKYTSIEGIPGEIELIKNMAMVRSETMAEGVGNGIFFKMRLQILQVWMWEKNKWLLIARQSVKLNG